MTHVPSPLLYRTSPLALFLLLVAAAAVSRASAGVGDSRAAAAAGAPGGNIFVGGRRRFPGRAADKRDDARASFSSSSTPTRVVVEYLDESGREAIERIRRSARNDEIGLDLRDRRIVTVDVDAEGYDELAKNPHIKHVETDAPIFRSDDSYSSSSSSSSSNNNGVHFRRRLEELTEAIEMIQADQLEMGPDPPLVCVADSGFALGHPDLPLSPFVDGSDMTLPSGRVLRWTQDYTGHGTATAGLIAAVEGNGIGYRGVAPGVRLYITRGLDDNGKSTLSQLMMSVEQCLDSGAKIISLSLGCDCPDMKTCRNSGCYSDITRDYFTGIIADRGVLVVGAAGNQGLEIPFYPASYPAVLSVAGANRSYGRFGLSNVNDQVELAALGYLVKTIRVDNATEYGYGFRSGTSIATPAVSASAALLWSHFPTCTNAEIRTALGRTAMNVNANGGCDNNLGFGIVQVKDAYDLLLERGCSQDGRLYGGGNSTCDASFLQPTSFPTQRPTDEPTPKPSEEPTVSPVTDFPTTKPTTGMPIKATLKPTMWQMVPPDDTFFASQPMQESSSSSLTNSPVNLAFVVLAHTTVLLYQVML